MKKLFFKIILMALMVLIPASVMAQVDVKVRVNVPLPPAIVFPAPPALVVIPNTYVYTAPDVDDDIFFYSGWWWRPWEGRWYRSRHYDRGWQFVKGRPAFYKQVPSDWRRDYREHRWKGQEWNSRPIPQADVEKNWRGWQKNKHWERENNWGVQRPQARPGDSRLNRNRPDDRSGKEPGRGTDRMSQDRQGKAQVQGPQSGQVKMRDQGPQKSSGKERDRGQQDGPGRGPDRGGR